MVSPIALYWDAKTKHGALRRSPPFHGSRSSGRYNFRMHAVKGAVAKLQYGTRIEHKPLFLKLFGRSRDSPVKSRDIPPKSLVSLCFEGHTEIFWPPPVHVEDPTPPENIRNRKFGFGLLRLAIICAPESRNAFFFVRIFFDFYAVGACWLGCGLCRTGVAVSRHDR